MQRIHIHWTGGSYTPNAKEKRHYHFLVDGYGNVVEGNLAPEANLNVKDGVYAAHTGGANTGAIGVGLCGMHNAKERPLNTGRYPLKQVQIEALADLCGRLCEIYSIPVTATTVLTHAEVGPNLKVKQNGKWDVNWLPGMPEAAQDPNITGEVLRSMIRQSMSGKLPAPKPEVPGVLTLVFNAILDVLSAFKRSGG